MKQESISTIHDAGGHLVLCKPNKRPCWMGWQKQRPALDVSIQHDGPLGIIPYSIGTSALDVDIGDWRKLPTILGELWNTAQKWKAPVLF